MEELAQVYARSLFQAALEKGRLPKKPRWADSGDG